MKLINEGDAMVFIFMKEVVAALAILLQDFTHFPQIVKHFRCFQQGCCILITRLKAVGVCQRILVA